MAADYESEEKKIQKLSPRKPEKCTCLKFSHDIIQIKVTATKDEYYSIEAELAMIFGVFGQWPR